MFALLAISALAAAAVVGSMFELFSSSDSVDNSLGAIEDSDGFGLLQTGLLDDLQEGALSEIEAGAPVLDAEAVRGDYEPTGSVEIQGSDDDDFIDAGPDVEVTFGEAGNDVVFGAIHDQVIFGGEGEDVVFAEGGDDQVFGDEGDDILVAGDGNDLIVGGDGIDTLFGGVGDDTIFTATGLETTSDADAFEIAAGGAGDDQIHVGYGTALLELGEGADDVLVHSETHPEGDNPLAVITDFDPAEDQLFLGVYAPDFEFEGDSNSLEISYTLTEIETSQGPATLVVPSVDDADLQAALGRANVGHAVLIGVTPLQIAENDIKVLVESDASINAAPDSISNLFSAQSVGSGL